MTETDFKNQAIADNTLEETKAKRTVLVKVTLSARQQEASSGEFQVDLDSTDFDLGSDFDTSTNYEFTAPYAGFYRVDVVLNFYNITDGDRIGAKVRKNQPTDNVVILHKRETVAVNMAGNGMVSGSTVVQLSASDTLRLYGVNHDDTTDFNQSSTFMCIEYLGNS